MNPQFIVVHGGVVKHVYKYIPAVATSLPQHAVYALRRNPEVAYVEPDYKFYLISLARSSVTAKPAPTQPPQSIPWGVVGVGAPQVWSEYINGSGVKVAVLDGGIDVKHSDLMVYGGAEQRHRCSWCSAWSATLRS